MDHNDLRWTLVAVFAMLAIAATLPLGVVARRALASSSQLAARATEPIRYLATSLLRHVRSRVARLRAGRNRWAGQVSE